jgi:hypothetical protein
LIAAELDEDVWPGIRETEPERLHQGPVELEDELNVEGVLRERRSSSGRDESETHRGYDFEAPPARS